MTYNGHVGAGITRYSKSIVATIGSVLTVLTALTAVVPEPANGYVATAIAIGTGISTYLIRNTKSAVDLADEAAALGYELKARVR
jgi:hypothetical protein